MFRLIVVLSLVATPAFAGSCRYYSDGGHGVSSCSNGSFTIYRFGRQEQWGHRNGGFRRYDYEVPVYPRHRDD